MPLFSPTGLLNSGFFKKGTQGLFKKISPYTIKYPCFIGVYRLYSEKYFYIIKPDWLFTTHK
jgi:hypothetical protein